MQYYQPQQKNTTSVAGKTNDLIGKVGKLILLPTNEIPTVATVTDASKLKNQPFFKNASNGDKVLIYVKAKEAILYNPTRNLVITVGPVDNSSQTPKPSVTPILTHAPNTPTPTPTVMIRRPRITPIPTISK